MRVKVRLLGVLAALLGGSEVEVQLPDGATVGELLSRLAESDEAVESVLEEPPLVLVNGRLARAEDKLRDGDEVVVVPSAPGG